MIPVAHKNQLRGINQAQPNIALQPTRASQPLINIVVSLAAGVLSLAWSAEFGR